LVRKRSQSKHARQSAQQNQRGSAWQEECAAISRQKAKAKRWSDIRRRTTIILAVAIPAYIGLGGWWLWQSGTMDKAASGIEVWGYDVTRRLGFEVQQIRVEGVEALPAMKVVETAGIMPGDPMLRLDVHSARERLRQLAEVREVRIERKLPDQVVIIINERQPYALWQHDGRQQWIDRDGTVLTHQTRDANSNDIVLVGDNVPQYAEHLFTLFERLPSLQKQVMSAQRIGNRRWNVTLRNGMVIKLPQDHMDAAWTRLEQMVQKEQLLERAVRSVDLRFEDRTLLTLEEATENGNIPRAGVPRAAEDI
jgi:cell division protein FtsQ